MMRLAMNVRNWWEYSGDEPLGDESETIKFRRPRQQMSSPRWEPSLIDWFLYDRDLRYERVEGYLSKSPILKYLDSV